MGYSCAMSYCEPGVAFDLGSVKLDIKNSDFELENLV